ncbi:unnamed protein product [Lactuca virosa]|uniref:Reverse transcriptase zinc-binding domain-containing protein n=1 Tax=Lactuca virosa TaxID=75947 RepID=A0AAU9M8L4_9ASTR|nr:unnamed protein product [Lactuca virosa]
MFVWRLLLIRLATTVNLDSIGIDVLSILCLVCNEVSEDKDHLFVNCEIIVKTWNSIARWIDINCPVFGRVGDGYVSLEWMLYGFQSQKDVVEVILGLMWWMI